MEDEQDVLLSVPGGKIDVTLPMEPLKISRQELLVWVKACANAVSNYYGRFPVAHLTLRISAGGRRGAHRGVTYARNGGLILIQVGPDTQVSDLKEDWVLTHEMIHLAFPDMAPNHHWIEEGISTYVEPVARAQVGALPVAEMWRVFIQDMPKGEPGYGDEGLDNTPTWGRTYWGGAMFCLAADVQIRERTHNRKGLQDALRGIVAAGGNINKDWEIEKTLAAGDRATGTNVLLSLYRKMRDKPAPVDLAQVWTKLGLELKDGSVVFNDHAAEANIRRAITARKVQAKRKPVVAAAKP
ncbi:MAG TPA: hypothetical protein VEW69_05190 [Alphaproteobacteria bacterium]|nr:hypothetical protein [Alphaproteobacteria bacterium]